MKQYDLIVLGSGGAGYRVAIRCREAGWKVALIEEYKIWGGTCDNRGCMPKKVLVGAAELADANYRYKQLGIVAKPARLDWRKLVEFKRGFTQAVSEETKEPLMAAGVDLYEGSPRFVSESTIEINGEKLESRYFQIAVGAKPAKLDLPGASHLAISEDFLDLTELPSEIVFVGGGYVSFELAHVAVRFGARITILHGDDRPLPAFDRDCVNTLIKASEAAGIRVVLNARVGKVEKRGNKVLLNAGQETFEADLAVNGAGRPPAIDTLNLEAANVAFGKRGVVVDEHLKSTTNQRVYAGGDAAAAGLPLSPVARLHGTIVADNLLGIPTKQPSYMSSASVVFTEPPLAKVGLTETEAKEKGYEFDVHSKDMSSWYDAKRTGQKHTFGKVLVDKKTGTILGAHLIGNHTEELINMFSLAIYSGITAQKFKAPIFAFPTASDDVRYLL